MLLGAMDKSNLSQVNMFLCDKIIVDEDHVLSAIRIIDIYYVSPRVVPGAEALSEDVRKAIEELPTVITINCLIDIKTRAIDTEDHQIELRMQKADASKEIVLVPSQKVNFRPMDQDTPGGVAIGVGFHITVKSYGTTYIVALIDGLEVARTPLTIRKRPSETPTS